MKDTAPQPLKREEKVQRILVFQQRGSGESKIAGIRRFGRDRFLLETISIDEALPPIIDDPDEYLPAHMEAELVLDYFRHPDLSYGLARRCARLGIPVVASGKKLEVKEAITPVTCCGLGRHADLGAYGRHFGAPEFEVDLDGEGRISSLRVLRGAPCGATWDAAERVVGMNAQEAAVRIGLETQFFCSANPAGWDPMYGKSPVHFAGEMHKHGLVKAIERFLASHEDMEKAAVAR